MSTFAQQIATMSPLQLAYAAKEMRQKARLIDAEPIAIIGLGCRFPGAESPDAFWALLRNGGDAIREVPSDRWQIDAYYDNDPNAPGKMYTRQGGFVAQSPYDFDSDFFGISPREAASLDPQQRLLLEVSWEALEDAALSAEQLAGSATGVFVGICSSDYFQQLVARGAEQIDHYLGTGNSASVAAGRLSYFLGLQGPSLAVDTACSSSLVTVHLACQSLRRGECDVALAGGVNRILSPELSINFSRARMLAADGRCKTFDAAADGYVRGEGCGMVVLKRLSDARADGDHVVALIRGSAVNQDGRTSGLTVPNGPAQQAVIRQALDNSGIFPAQVSYVEAHGTGTALGDPIEVAALGEIFNDRSHPLLIGSVKTNFGHLEGAAGIAGLIKVTLSLQHGEIPPHLHFQAPNPRVAWENYQVQVATEVQPWSANQKFAGVSSFGFSGTNAHVVLQEAPLKKAAPTINTAPLHLLTLSAKSAAALEELAARYERYLATTQANWADICLTSQTGRSHFSHRLAIVAENAQDALEKLHALRTGEPVVGVFQGQVKLNNKIAFLFTGQGSQYVDMGRALYDTQPLFRQTLDRCDELLRPHLGRSLLAILYPDDTTASGATDQPNSLIDETAYTQPALFALQYALAQLWKAWGIAPDVVLGHSVGELVAACVAGVFSLEDGLKLIAERGRLMQSEAAEGEMFAVFAPEAICTAAIAPFADQISIAAINGPQNTVIAGSRTALQQVIDTLAQQGIKSKRLTVSHAFHSPLMEPILADFRRVARRLRYAAPQLDLISNLTGQLATEAITTADYWTRHIRQPVRFADGMTTLHQMGANIFVEIGPKPMLLGMGRSVLPDDATATGLWLPSLRPDADWQHMLHSLAALYVQGIKIDWLGLNGGNAARRCSGLPTYAWQRERHGELPVEAYQRRSQTTLGKPLAHPLLQKRLQLAGAEKYHFSSQLRVDAPAYLGDHRFFERAILPASAYLEIALKAGEWALKEQPIRIQELVMPQALILANDQETDIQVTLTADGEGYVFQIFTPNGEDARDEDAWRLHAFGKILPEGIEAAPHHLLKLEDLRAQCTEVVNVEAYYKQLSSGGINYGPAFQALVGLWRHAGQALGEIQLPQAVSSAAGSYQFHPVLLDACLQVVGAALLDFTKETYAQSYIAVGLARFQHYRIPTARVWSYSKVHAKADGSLSADVILLTPDGEPIAHITDLQVKKISSLAFQEKGWQDWLYELQWHSRPRLGGNFALPIAGQLKNQLADEPTGIASKLDLVTIAHLETLALNYIVAAFAKLGESFRQGERFSTAALVQRLGVVAAQQKLFGRLLETLAEAGFLQTNNGHWEVIKSPASHALFQEPGSFLPDVSTEIYYAMLDRCGKQLAEVLSGKCDPLQLLFPGGDLSLTTRLYEESLEAQMMNRKIQQVISKVLETLPPGQGIRILEIGAGTGSTTAHLLPHLPATKTAYTFTDISPLFLAKAKEKFDIYPFIEYRLLNIEEEGATQGFTDHSYEIVVAANVLHATRSLRDTIKHIHQLLAPGGLLILLEGTAPTRWLDLTFGLTEGWWRFTDRDLRPNYPLLSANGWQTLLCASGFDEAVTILQAKNEQAVIVAQAVQAPVPSAADDSQWLILADQGGVGEQLAGLLQEKGAKTILAYLGAPYEQLSDAAFRVSASPADIHRLVASIPTITGVIHCWSLDTQGALDGKKLETAAHNGAGSALSIVQALMTKGVDPLPDKLWFVTRSSQAVHGAPAEPGVAQAPLWGIGKVIALEAPALWGGMIDLPPVSTLDVDAITLRQEIVNPTGEDHIAFRASERYVARLMRLAVDERGEEDGDWRVKSEGSYLITGGLGELGLKVAVFLAEEGAQHLVLLGRSKPQGAALETLHQLEARGVTLYVVQADVADEVQMRAVLVNSTWPPLCGIVHCAGSIGYGDPINELTVDTLDQVLRPKMIGAWLLAELTQAMNLDFLLYFSSMVAVWGSKGQGDYVAANHFLDMCAHLRQGMGQPVLSINWGLWDSTGSTPMTMEARGRLAQIGVKELATESAFDALRYVLRTARTQTIVANLDWSLYKTVHEAQGRRPLLEQISALGPTTNWSGQEQESKKASFLQKLEVAPFGERKTILLAHLQQEVAQILGFANSRQPNPRQGLFEMGMDSLTAVELKNRIERLVGAPLRATLAFDFPTITQLTEYLVDEVFGWSQTPDAIADPKEDAVDTWSEIEALSEDDFEDALTTGLAELESLLGI